MKCRVFLGGVTAILLVYQGGKGNNYYKDSHNNNKKYFTKSDANEKCLLEII